MSEEREFIIPESRNNAVRDTMPVRVINSATKEVVKAKIKKFLEEKRAYLDPAMSLQKFSQMTSTNTTYMSNTINDCFGCSFRTLLNAYRVDHATMLMTNEGGLIQELYAKCGFASRSAFYASFKTIKKMTPLQYLKKHTSDNGAYRKLHREEKK